MNIALRLVLVIMLFASSGVRYSPHSAKQTMHERSDLEVRTRIVEQKYCSSSSVLLTLQLEYKNAGEHSLILFKYALPPLEYRVSRNTEDARKKRYEKVISPMVGGTRSSSQFGDEPPSNEFLILQPGQSHAPSNTIPIPLSVADTDEDIAQEYLRPGEHVLQVSLFTWPFAPGVEQELRSRWQRFGTLWTSEVLSLPTTFQVAKVRDRRLSNCNSAADLQRD